MFAARSEHTCSFHKSLGGAWSTSAPPTAAAPVSANTDRHFAGGDRVEDIPVIPELKEQGEEDLTAQVGKLISCLFDLKKWRRLTCYVSCRQQSETVAHLRNEPNSFC